MSPTVTRVIDVATGLARCSGSSDRQRQALEHLGGVPPDVRLLRQWRAGSGPQRSIVQVVHAASRLGPRGEGSADEHPVDPEAEDAAVEQLVVQGAQRQAVVELVRAVEGEPADVRSV
jgi:hypothetical protein